ncbi:MAG: hypothetical protein ACI9EW_003174, partial [Cellvibrionaceae bacterium]
WQLAYGVIGSLIWTVLFYVWANRAFEKHIIQG